MNSEEFIEKSLRGCLLGDHPMARRIANEVIENTLSAYRESRYHCLDELISESMSEIKDKSQLINCLSKPHGITASYFADQIGCSVQTARKKLNKSVLSVVKKISRPYIYSLNRAA